MSKRIFFTRHGETEWNTVRRIQGHQNSDLTEHGVKQARWLRDRLADETIDVIYASPLGRAFETAKIIAEVHDVPLMPVDELKELYFGSWESYCFEEMEAKYPEKNYYLWNEPEKYVPIDGESIQDLINRTGRFYEEVLLKSPYQNILVVAHAIALKALFAYIRGDGPDKLWTGKHLNPTSLTLAYVNQECIEFEFVGDTSHHQEKSQAKGWFDSEE